MSVNESGPNEANAEARRKFLRESLGAVALVPTAMLPAMTASARTPELESVSNAYFNVRDNGALGDGVTDDTIAIQGTIALAVANGGGIVLFPPGTYKVSSTLNVSGVGVHLRGFGASTSIIEVPANANDTIKFSGVDSGGIFDLKISSASPRTSGRSVFLEQTANVVVERVNFEKQFIAIQIDGGYCQRIRNCSIGLAANGTGVFIGSTYALNDQYLDNIFVAGGAFSFRIQRSGAVWMNACDSISSVHGLTIDPPSGLGVTFCFFSNCAWDSTSAACVYIAPTGTGFVSALTFVNCWSASSSGGDCVVVAGANVNGCEFVGHRFLNASIGNGLWVSGAKNVHVDACVASGIINGSGFAFLGNAQNFAIRNSHSGSYGGPTIAPMAANKYGITVLAGCSSYMIANNTLRGNAAASIIDAGSAPKVVSSNLT